MKLTAALALSICFQPFIAYAQAANSAADCAKVLENSQRLSCYDHFFPRQAEGAAASSDPKPAKSWHSFSEPSSMTDTVSHWVASNSETPVKCNSHSPSDNLTMIISCHENKTNITIEGEGCYFSKYWGKVEYRLDDQPMKTVRMIESNDNSALGLWGGKQSIPFVKSMLGASKIRLRIVPVSENSIETTFDLTGLSDVVAPVRKACGW